MTINEKLRRRWQSVAPRSASNLNNQFFEGWFYKLVNRDNYCLAIIPGRFLSPSNSYDFVQVFDGQTNRLWRYEQKLRDQSADFEFAVGDCRFRPEGILLGLETVEGSLTGKVDFHQMIHWDGALPHPAMGFFSLAPRMQCSHSVLSLKHQLAGALTIDGTTIDFSGGYGYLEKTWGQRFPNAWLWSQCGDFDSDVESMFLSAATVPIGRFGFAGLTAAVLNNKKKFYRWGSWRFERARVAIEDGDIVLSVNGWKNKLELRWQNAASISDGNPNVPVPTVDGLQLRVHETLNRDVELRIVSRIGGREICNTAGKFAALDLVNLDVLIRG